MPKVYILELNRVFDSIAAAARAVGVDPSNAAKVIRGKRATAGGYHFGAFGQNADLERVISNIEGRIKTSVKRKVLTKAESNARKNLIENIHDLLVDTNKRYRNAKKAGIYKTDPVLQKMMSHTDFYGANKLGGYDTSKSHLRTFTNEELQNLADLIQTERGEYAKNIYDRMSRHRNIATYAAQFGITIPQAQKYFNIYPVLFELFAVAKQNTEYNYNDVTGELYDAMQGDADPDELLDFILDLKNVYQGNTTQSLESVLDKWSESREAWQENWEVLHE